MGGGFFGAGGFLPGAPSSFGFGFGFGLGLGLEGEGEGEGGALATLASLSAAASCGGVSCASSAGSAGASSYVGDFCDHLAIILEFLYPAVNESSIFCRAVFDFGSLLKRPLSGFIT